MRAYYFMFPHHEQSIQKLKEHFEVDNGVIAFIIIGSVARGEAGKDSDIDFCLVVTDEEYQRRTIAKELNITFNAENANGGAVTLDYLTRAVTKAPEPLRFAFTNAIVVFTKDSALPDIINKIQMYPENEQEEKMISFVNQLPVHLSYLKFGEYSKNPYVLSETALKLVLFGGRLILAHNRLLYPSRKQFFKQLERAKDKPENFLSLATILLQNPSIAHAQAFYDCIMSFKDWKRPQEGNMQRYTDDTKQGNLEGKSPIEEV